VSLIQPNWTAKIAKATKINLQPCSPGRNTWGNLFNLTKEEKMDCSCCGMDLIRNQERWRDHICNQVIECKYCHRCAAHCRCLLGLTKRLKKHKEIQSALNPTKSDK